MGKYNGAVITTVGQTLIANAIAGSEAVIFTKMRTSSTAISPGTNLESLTSLSGIEQAEDITNASVYGTDIIQISANFPNTSIATAYYVQAVGVYGKLSADLTETLIAVCTAVTPDEVPVYDSDSPASFIYNIQLRYANADTVTLSVNNTGTATVADLALKVDLNQGELAETIVGYSQVSTAPYPVPAVGEAMKVILGKIIKFFTDIKSGLDNLGANQATNVNLGFVYLNQADIAGLCTYVSNNFYIGKPYSISTNVAIARILSGDSVSEVAVGVMEKQSATVCKYVIGRPNANGAFFTGYFNPSDSTQAVVIQKAINKGGNGDVENTTVDAFTASSASYPVPAAGDTLKVSFGKIAKFFGDIKSAFVNAAVSGTTITLTKADGTTKTLTTQDTTYSDATNAAHGLLTASGFRQLFNRISASDNNYNTNNAGKVWKCAANGQPAWGTDNNTTYSAGTGLSLSGTTMNHSNSVSAGTAGTSSATSGQNTLAVPYVTYDAQGHVTASGTHTHTINAMGAASSGAAGKTGLVPQPTAGKQASYLRGDATWVAPANNLTTTAAGSVLDARQGKTLKDLIDHVGVITSNGISSAVSVSNSWKNLTSISLPAGKYIITGCATTAASQTGKAFTLAFSEGSFRDSAYCLDANRYSASVTDCLSLGATTTVYLTAWAGTSTSIESATITAVRLA